MHPIVFRLLLALCLVLNGIGNAIAGAAMTAMPEGAHEASMAVSMPHAAPDPSTACDHGSPAAVPALASLDIPMTHPADCGKDCCVQGACSCPCVPSMQVALANLPVLPSRPGSGRIAEAPALGHGLPAPLNLIRPPIG